MQHRLRRQSLPIDARDQPLPLRLIPGARRGPDEASTVQAALAPPATAAVPDQQLDAVAALVAKGVGAAIARCAAQGLLYPQ